MMRNNRDEQEEWLRTELSKAGDPLLQGFSNSSLTAVIEDPPHFPLLDAATLSNTKSIISDLCRFFANSRPMPQPIKPPSSFSSVSIPPIPSPVQPMNTSNSTTTIIDLTDTPLKPSPKPRTTTLINTDQFDDFGESSPPILPHRSTSKRQSSELSTNNNNNNNNSLPAHDELKEQDEEDGFDDAFQPSEYQQHKRLKKTSSSSSVPQQNNDTNQVIIDDNGDFGDFVSDDNFLSMIDVDAAVNNASSTSFVSLINDSPSSPTTTTNSNTVSIAIPRDHTMELREKLKSTGITELEQMAEKHRRKEADLSSKILSLMLDSKGAPGSEEEKEGLLQQRTELQAEIQMINEILQERKSPPPPIQINQQQLPQIQLQQQTTPIDEPQQQKSQIQQQIGTNQVIVDKRTVRSITEWVTDRERPGEDLCQFKAFSTDWSKKTFPWSNEIYFANRQVFGHRTFRPHQLEVVNAAMAGHDCFVLMPTGGGKSLCFQLPTICREGITIVISPLISLIQDQVESLTNASIRAALLNSSIEKEQADSVFQQLRDPKSDLKMLYITPEKIKASGKLQNCLQEMSRGKRLQMIVVDEAHCISQWGHDFRPDYANLRWFKRVMPDVPMMLLTATATDRVKTDTLYSLGVKRCLCFKQSFNRANLRYFVKKKAKKSLEDLIDWIKTNHPNDTGIIYCLSQRECEQLAAKLKEHGLSAGYYHGAMEGNERSSVQRSWSNDELRIVCATLAFGMGIDKPDVRYVIHFSLPKTLEGYYQESGRAGRDGEPADCILYYMYADKFRLDKLIEGGARDMHMSQAALDAQKEGVMRVVEYAENTVECRRSMQLRYFGEDFDPIECHSTCDNCASKATIEMIDRTQEAIVVLNAIRSMATSDTVVTIIVDVLRGSKNRRVVDSHYDTLPEYGKLKQMPKPVIQDIIHRLVRVNALAEHVTYHEGYAPVARLQVGKSINDFMRSGKLLIAVRSDSKAKLDIEAKSSSKRGKREENSNNNNNNNKRNNVPMRESDDVLIERLFDELSLLRKQILDEEHILAHHVFPQQTLREMATKCPMTEEEFLDLTGVSHVKCSKYGERFMHVIREFVGKYGKPSINTSTSPIPEIKHSTSPIIPLQQPPQQVSRFFQQQNQMQQQQQQQQTANIAPQPTPQQQRSRSFMAPIRLSSSLAKFMNEDSGPQ